MAALTTGSVLMNVSTTSALSVAAGSALATVPAAYRPRSLVVLVVAVGLIQLLAGVSLSSSLRRGCGWSSSCSARASAS